MRKAREVGVSRWTLAKKVKLVVDSLVSFSFIPLRFMSVVGALFSMGAAIWAIVLVICKLLGTIEVAGWTTLIVINLFSSGLIMLTLGILGEYVWRTLDASRKRPVFIVDELIDNNKA